MNYEEFKEKIQKLPIARQAFLSILFFSGCRVSEALALTPQDIRCTKDMIYIQFHRLKGSKQTDPTPLPRADALEWLCQQSEKKGPTVPVFLFSRTTAHRIIKRVFPNLYANYFRMNRITKMGGYSGAAKRLGIASWQSAYSKQWYQIQKKRISEFGNICPITGNSKKLHVHHIDFDPENNEVENLIPLWTPYHRLIHARAGVSQFYEELDRVVLSSITEVWRSA